MSRTSTPAGKVMIFFFFPFYGFFSVSSSLPHASLTFSLFNFSFFSNTEVVFLVSPYPFPWNPNPTRISLATSMTLSLPLKLRGLADSAVYFVQNSPRISSFGPFSSSFFLLINWASFAYPHADFVVVNLWFCFSVSWGIAPVDFMKFSFVHLMFSVPVRTGVAGF